MKFKKKRKGNYQATHSTGFRTNVQQRKQRRKLERKQKKKNRAVYAARQQRNTTTDSTDTHHKTNLTSNKIQNLKAFVDGEKKKLKGESKMDEARSSPTIIKAENIIMDKPVSPAQEEETEGFKASTSASDRLARLQEYVNQEAGISRAASESDKNSKNKTGQTESNLEDKKENTIKDKQKLKSLKCGVKEDTKEINKLAKLLGYKSHQKKKIAPVFADDFGGLLGDIEEGNMANAEKYEKDDDDDRDSDEDFEKDMAIALGQAEDKNKGESKERLAVDMEEEDASEDFMNDDFKANESGICGEYEEVDENGDYEYEEVDENGDYEYEEVDENDYYEHEEENDYYEHDEEDENYYHEHEEENDYYEYEGDESDFYDEGDENDYYNNTKSFGEASSNVNDIGSNPASESDKDEGDFDNFESTNNRSSPVEDSDVNDSDVEDEDEQSGFLDSQAEECSDEESDNDEELVHDFRTEYELAFEGGCGYSKPEILKNGQENDIDRYSSNSDDDEDLEGFIVDDNDVEFENVSDELPDELSDSSPIKKRRRLIVNDDDSDEDDGKEKKDLESEIPREDVYDVSLVSMNKSEVPKKIRTRKQQNPKKKKDFDVINSTNEHEKEVKTIEKENRVLSSPSEEDETSGLNRERKKIRKRTYSDSEDSDYHLEKSSTKQIKTILKKQSTLKSSQPLPKKKRRDRVSFDLPSITEDESSQNEKDDDHDRAEGKDGNTEEKEPALHVGGRNRIGKFLKIPDVSDDDSDGDPQDTREFGENEENESVYSSEFSDDENESLGSAKFSEDGEDKFSEDGEDKFSEDAQGNEFNAVREMQSSSKFRENEENESLDSTDFTDDENESLGSAEFSEVEDAQEISFDAGSEVRGSTQLSENESLGSAEFSDDEEDNQEVRSDAGSEMHGTAQLSENEENESLGSAEFSEDESDLAGSAEFSDGEDNQDIIDKDKTQLEEKDDLREDIYGRLRDKEGNIIQEDSGEAGNGRYIPPALRKLMALNTSEKKKEQLDNLRKTLKGLLNRLAESNMAGIISQIEGMYIKQSRNDMNEMLTNLFFESLVAPTLTPERLVQEHAMLVAVLSTNVGNEVGAHILNEFVLRWNDEMQHLVPGEDIETKELDNLLLFLANLYNFRVMNARLIYDILHKLAHSFTNKEVELILLVLRSVGFTLRKEDPLALKSLITKIQTQASMTEAKNEDIKEFSRVQFTLEVVQAIRNNNMAKVPNYDPSHVEHLKKVLKGLMRKGNQASQLNITLEDLLKAREHGRWWIVGSAWSGEKPLPDQKLSDSVKSNTDVHTEFSEKFKERAAKLQLSRPPRINILYVITEGSEDYLDAFEKLLQLSLPSQQEREVFNVILLCCQKGKVYNPFFAHLADRMCNFDEKYKRLLQFALWDKFKEIESIKPREVANLAKFVTHLIGENSLNLSVFKNISFMEVDSQMISFIRQILIALLLHPAGSDSVERIFSGLSASPKLRILRQSLRIFILKFLSTKKNKENADHLMLTKRIQDVTEILSRGGGVQL